MKLMALAILAAGAGMASADTSEPATPIKVTVCVQRIADDLTVFRAETTASQMLSTADVTVAWHWGIRNCPADGIVVQFSQNTPAKLLPRALARAYVFEGTHIQVFYDRVYGTAPTFVARLLGHVLAHEISHLLQDFPRHSSEGIMKARWDRCDYLTVRFGLLKYTAEDIQLIHDGWRVRHQQLTLRASADAPGSKGSADGGSVQ